MAFGKAENKVSLLEKKMEEQQEPEIEYSIDELEMNDMGKTIITVYGPKGVGKTALAYGLIPDNSSVVVWSYDGMSTGPRELEFIKKANLSIRVLNAILPLNKSSPDAYTKSASVTYDMNVKITKQIAEQGKPDWIILDCFEVFSEICEMKMRFNNKISAYGGITNKNIWKERKQFVDGFNDVLKDSANCGVIYIMYPKVQNLYKNGEIINTEETPAWISEIMKQTLVTIRASSEFDVEANIRKYYAEIEHSKKEDEYPPGKYDITGKRLYEVIRGN
jgi:hypothetical protein